MLDVTMLRKNLPEVVARLKTRNFDFPVDAFNDFFGSEFSDEEFDTVGGLIIDRLGRIPAAGEDVTLEYGGLEFTVLEVEDRRVGKVKCTRAPELNPENDDDEEEDA